jgi:DNA-binding CsgD family transcriptional regulator
MRELAADSDGPSVRVSLTVREREILRLVCDGFTDGEIGRRLFVSMRTVQNDLRRIRDKTGLERRSELVRWAAIRSLA